MNPLPLSSAPASATVPSGDLSHIIAPGASSPAGGFKHWPFIIPAAEREEFDTLPDDVRAEVVLLLGVFRIAARAKCRTRIFAAQSAALAQRGRGFTAKSLARKWYAYVNAHGDWRALVNRARVPEERGLPVEFVEFVQGWFVKNKRVSRQQWLKLVRFWGQGCDDRGNKFTVPGYGRWQDWFAAEHPSAALPPKCPGIPRGWSYSTLMRSRLTKAQERMAREGETAARALTPHVLGTRAGLRFLEQVTFDDVKTDFRVIDSLSGEVCDLWLLVAFDTATAVCLGYGMRPARVREDGSQEHLKLIDMKQLCGWVLERWGLPASYPITWKLENGCATIPEATALALRDLSNGAINVSYARMLNGTSAAGYKERALGNSRGKASHESHNNLLHNMAGDLPGQTGRRWDVRPADLGSREKEAREIHALAQQLAPDLRAQAKYPVLTLLQARDELNRILEQMNSRTLHELENFADLAEWRPNAFAAWEPIATFPEIVPAGYETRTRKESPYERMTRLVSGLEWRRVPRSTLVHFYHDTQKLVKVDERGEISFTHEKREHVFCSPVGRDSVEPGRKFLAYFHPLEPDFLHLTQLPPHSGYVATWPRRERVRNGDAAALRTALHYTESALKAQREHLHRVSDERAETQAMRAHNARLLEEQAAQQSAIEVSGMHAIAPSEGRETTAADSATGAALDAAQETIRAQRARARREETEEADLAALASAAFRINERNNEPEDT